MWGEMLPMPTIEDISRQMIISVASTLTHISIASTNRGRTTVCTIRKMVLPATKAGMLQFDWIVQIGKTEYYH
jgi:ABC-type phosphate transport system permease subunit